MARYDYRCSSCGEVFEVEHRMTAHPAISCPACGNSAGKLFCAAGIVFDGSGFYNTDQRDVRAADTAVTGGSETGKRAAEAVGAKKVAAGAGKTSPSGDGAAPNAQKRTPATKDATRGK